MMDRLDSESLHYSGPHARIANQPAHSCLAAARGARLASTVMQPGKAHKLTYQGMPGVLSLHGSEPLFSSLASALRLLRRTARGGRGSPGARQRLCCCCRLACAIAFGALQLLLQDSQRLLVLPGLCGCGHVCRAGGGLRDGEQR